MELMGRGELHAVVAAKGKDVGKSPSRFHQWLADFHNGEGLPGLDQVLPGLLEIFVADRVFPLEACQAANVSAQLIRQTPMASTAALICRI